MTSARREQVKDAIAGIREFYRQGKQIPRKQAHAEAYGERDLAKEAERLGMSESTARQTRQFADPELGYTPAEVNELCRLIKSVQIDQDASKPVFSKSYIIPLLSVPRSLRAVIQRQAIDNAWSFARLKAEIAKQREPKRKGGRSRRVAQGPADLLTQLRQECESWRRWNDDLDGQLKARKRLELPGGVEALLGAVIAVIVQLQDAVVRELQKMRPATEGV